ncbi:MAG TPA: hypothetical protein VLN45_03525, partial [Ignavibacteriaceae bacterium]|nr:hypothetical protein [Ignavibacteriaceae bacterium]
MLSLNQRLSQQQKLSPQQIQYQKLLQLNTLALEQRIKTELELNPILEEVTEEELTQDEKKDDEDPEEFEDYDKEEFTIEDYMNDVEFDSGDKVNRSNDDEIYHPVAPARDNLSELLTKQLTVLELNENQFALGEEIIGNLDDDGYLKRSIKDIVDELSMFAHIDISLSEAEKLLKRIQTFEPMGIASRNLQECLLVQLNQSKFDPYYKYLAQQLLETYFDDFTKRRFDAIKLKMNLTDETLKSTIDLIQKLNPKPGEGNIESDQLNQISPDFIIEKIDDNFVITLNDKSMP